MKSSRLTHGKPCTGTKMKSNTEIAREGTGNPCATDAACNQAAAQGVSAASPLADGVTTATSANPSLAFLDEGQQPTAWNHWGLNE
jgi:hypothetical protein